MYEILGLNSGASKEEINIAYKKLVLKWHPDKNKNNKEEATKKFNEITKAYQFLTNKTNDTKIDPYEIFKNMFDDNQQDEIPNVIITIEANIDKLHKGFCENISFTRFSECESCESFGTINKITSDCIDCKGKGIIIKSVEKENGKFSLHENKCNACNGNGINPNIELCNKCNGFKYTKELIECDVDVPPGAYDNYYIMLEGEGNYIPRDERKNEYDRSNVIVVIKEIPDEKIIRGMYIKGSNSINLADILIHVDIEFAESIVGIKKEINLFDEKIGFDIKGIIRNGDIHIIKNKGMKMVPEKCTNEKTHGDLFISFNVKKAIDISKQKQYRIWQILTDTPYPDYDDIDFIYETIELT